MATASVQHGQVITGPVADSIDTVSKLRTVALGAEIDAALFAHMTSAAGPSCPFP